MFGNSNSDASGTKSDDSFGDRDAWLVCTDLNYTVLWDTVYGGNDFDQLFAVQQDSNGFYLIIQSLSGVSGNKTTGSIGSADIWVLSIDLDGNILNQYTYGGTNSERPLSATFDNNQLFILSSSQSGVSGNKTTSNFGGNDYWLIQVNTINGIIDYQASFGTSNDEFFNAQIIKNSFGNIILAGTAYGNDGNKTDPGYGSNDIWLLELDQNLNIINEKCFGGDFEERLSNIIEHNGHYYIAAEGNSHISGNKTSPSFSFLNGNNPNWYFLSDLWSLKIDNNFNLIWDRSYGSGADEISSSVFYAEHDKLVLSCTSESNASGAGNKTTPNYGQEDVWVVITDLDGNILTQQNFGGTGEDYGSVSPGNSPTELFLNVFTNSSASSIGNMSVANNGNFDAWIADIDVQNWLTLAEENASKSIKVYPNPTENSVYLSETVERLEIRDAQGKVVQTLQNTNYTDLQQLPSGWYILEIKHNGKIERNKLVKR